MTIDVTGAGALLLFFLSLFVAAAAAAADSVTLRTMRKTKPTIREGGTRHSNYARTEVNATNNRRSRKVLL